ncbi:MAG: DoxX family protein [Terracidiphilus sp.]
MPAITSIGQSAPLSDDAASSPASSAAKPRRGPLWTGRVLTTLATLFLLFDAYGKLTKPSYVTDAFVQLGFSAAWSVDIGIILLVFTALYAVPRTTALGALCLTGYLGGAVAIQWRAANPLFETTFPILFAVLMWAGVFLRDGRLWSVIPIRRSR